MNKNFSICRLCSRQGVDDKILGVVKPHTGDNIVSVTIYCRNSEPEVVSDCQYKLEHLLETEIQE